MEVDLMEDSINLKMIPELLNILDNNLHLFSFRKDLIGLDNRVSNIKTLFDKDMTDNILQKIWQIFPKHWKFDVEEIQIQKYEDGGNIKIHREGHRINYLDMCVLKSNDKNGIYCYDSINQKWDYIKDEVGKIVRITSDKYHCIPKVYGERYSIVFIRYNFQGE
jgi:hypothetical protein